MDREAQEALAETRRLIAEGHEQILSLRPEDFDLKSTDVWPLFRRGVVRAEGCREVSGEELLRDLDQKPVVLAFLAEFAEKKRGYRRQVENVLRILLKGPGWLEAARAGAALRRRLAEAAPEVQALLAAEGSAEDAEEEAGSPSAPLEVERTASRAESVELVQAGFSALRELNFASTDEPAVAAFGKFGTGVARVLRRNIDEDLEVLALLEPKAPMLAFLCCLHKRRKPYRARVTAVLLGLLDTPALGAWRAAADGDATLRNDLESLGVLEHGAVGGDAASSGEEPAAEQPGVQLASGASAATGSSGDPRRVTWMWRDAGRYGGRLSHALANLNPVRWSNACTLEACIAELEQYLDTPRGERPVKLTIFGEEAPVTKKVANIAEAISVLREALARQ